MAGLIQVNDTVDWTYNGLTTVATVLAFNHAGRAHIQYTNAQGLLTTTTVPMGELELADGPGLRMYRVDADADTLDLLKLVLRDLGIRVMAQYPHYTVVATNESGKLATLVANLPGMTTRRLPGRAR